MQFDSEATSVRVRSAKLEGYAAAVQEISLRCYADVLRTRRRVDETMDDLDVVRFHLMQRYHWTPAVVRTLSCADMCFALSDELVDVQIPMELNEQLPGITAPLEKPAASKNRGTVKTRKGSEKRKA